MTNKKISKNSSVIWAAVTIAAVMLGYIIGISSLAKKSPDGDTYMFIMYSPDATYEVIENWSEGFEDVEVTEIGVFELGNSDGTTPSAYVTIEVGSMDRANQLAETFPFAQDGISVRKITSKE